MGSMPPFLRFFLSFVEFRSCFRSLQLRKTFDFLFTRKIFEYSFRNGVSLKAVLGENNEVTSEMEKTFLTIFSKHKLNDTLMLRSLGSFTSVLQV